MSTPRKDDDPKAAFDAEEPVQYESRKKRKRQDEDDDGSLVEDVAENVVEGVLEGCLLRPLIWLGTLPFRIIWRIIQGIFD